MADDPEVGSGAVRRFVRGPLLPERRSPLPGHRPKSRVDDASAPERVQQLIASPSYRQADEDIAFLRDASMRGVRLHLDYAKAEELLVAHGIEHTIVVFGSTRFPEPAEAARRFEAARAALAADPNDEESIRAVRRCARILHNSRYYDVARELGRIIAGLHDEAARKLRLAVMTGGGPGIMEAANRGAFEAGAKTVGLNIALPIAQYPNPYITPDLCLRFHYFAMRKLHFMHRARALVAFPGGFGTLDELFETLALVQTRKIAPVPIILVGESYWRRVIDFDFMLEEGVIDPEDANLFWFAESAADVWADINAYYRARGEDFIEG
ncbi:MAG TPA: TIGR00730 family Rossman fold protein [Casimicrobiaceae bacterium]|nr:TIGR00730 family Rossman fold protein [Casimicrobiaceae bacterium]